MASLQDLVLAQPGRDADDVEWLQSLVAELQLLADLAFADLVLWVPGADDEFVSVALSRPSSAATLFYRDFVGQPVPGDWRELLSSAYHRGEIVDSSALDWFEEIPTRLRAVPVRRLGSTPGADRPIAVLTRHTNLGQTRTPSRQELTFNDCANELLAMIAAGDFPDLEAPVGPRRGAPRASDGLIRLGADGVVSFASPNALSAFNRMGFVEELEGTVLADVTASLVGGKALSDESLPIVASGRASWRAEMESRGVTVSLRAIPVRNAGERRGAIVLSRDVTDLRLQEQELITKDATIREIHHRVKNNLQTVASLLRIQGRRATSIEAQNALSQAQRRVASIAIVHDTLSTGLSQNVDFDEVFERVLLLVAEVASSHNTTAHPRKTGSFGVLPSTYATPLALALTEVVTNAVEHGLTGTEGTVEIVAHRSGTALGIQVLDDGVGLPGGAVGEGLGTQIVRTLIEGELGGSITWRDRPGGGTAVDITVPTRWITAL